jgi:hypothetical protein
MICSQRGTSFTGVGNGDNAYYLDRFKFAEAGSPNGEFTITQASDGPNGFGNSMKLDCTTAETALAANEAIRLIYNIEGQDLQQVKKGTSDAEHLTLSFYVKSNLTGTAVVGLYDNDNTRYNAKSFTIDSANTWERKVLTYQPDTTGTLDDDNALSLQIYFWLQAGSNKTSGTLPSNWESNTEANQAVGQTINIASSTDNDFFITGVQLEVGSQATPFEHRSFGEEMNLARRYYYQIGNTILPTSSSPPYGRMGQGQAISSTTGRVPFFFPQAMRAIPTATVSNIQIGDGATGAISLSSSGIDTNTDSPDGVTIDFVVSSGLTTGQGCQAFQGNNSAGFVAFDAEL